MDTNHSKHYESVRYDFIPMKILHGDLTLQRGCAYKYRHRYIDGVQIDRIARAIRRVINEDHIARVLKQERLLNSMLFFTVSAFQTPAMKKTRVSSWFKKARLRSFKEPHVSVCHALRARLSKKLDYPGVRT